MGSAGLEGAGMEGRGTAGAVLDMSVWARITIMGLVAFLCELSARRRRELVFLGNLGISRRTWLAWALLTPLLMEAVVAVIAVTR